MLRLLSLNVKGYRSPDKQREVVQFAQKKRCDLLFLQETFLFSLSDDASFSARLSLKSYFSFASSRCTGVGVVFRRSMLSRSFCTYDPENRGVVFDCTARRAYSFVTAGKGEPLSLRR